MVEVERTKVACTVFVEVDGSFVLRLGAVEVAARLSGGACGAGDDFLLRWGHRGLSYVLERWAPLLGSLLCGRPDREHKQ